MGFFKKSVIKGIPDAAWGYMVNVHHIDVDTLSRQIRCVERKGTLDGGKPATFLRLFRLQDVAAKGVEVTGWETFDQHPDLILFEGYLTFDNKAHLEQKRP